MQLCPLGCAIVGVVLLWLLTRTPGVTTVEPETAIPFVAPVANKDGTITIDPRSIRMTPPPDWVRPVDPDGRHAVM